MEEQSQQSVILVSRHKDTKGTTLKAGVLFVAVGLFTPPPFIIIGVSLLVYGAFHRASLSYFCGNCGNAVQPTSRICPTCRAKVSAASFYEVERKAGLFNLPMWVIAPLIGAVILLSLIWAARQ